MDKSSLADIIGNVLQVLGSGAIGYSGRYVPTQQSQQLEANRQMALMQKQMDMEYQQKVALLAPETQAEIAKAEAVGDNNRKNQILIANGIQPLELEKIKAERTYGIMGGGAGATAAGASFVAGKK
jgi:hypothetical protein